jgi:hypothetical protein
LAAVYVALGDKDRAIRLIEKDYRRANALNRLKVDPVMDPLRQEPRFQEINAQNEFFNSDTPRCIRLLLARQLKYE